MNLLHAKRRAMGQHPQVAAAMIGAAAIGGGVSYLGSKSAASTQANAANAATQTQKDMFDKTVALNAPYNQQGQDAESKLSDLLGITPKAGSTETGSLLKPFGMSDFQMDPGVQFQMQQGNQALMNSQAAHDGVLSGGALKGLIGYNQGMAATGYQSAYERYMANQALKLGSLEDVTRIGQGAASGTTSAAPGFSSGIASTIQGAGQASAAGTVGAANALSGAATSSGNAYFLNSLLNNNKNADLGGPITTSANPGGVFTAPASQA